jgi:hypothetical protein
MNDSCECRSLAWTREHLVAARAVRTVGIDQVLQEMQASAIYADEPVFSDPCAEESFRILVWCLLNDAIYYAAPTERFCELLGRLRAVEKGRSVVVLEDMS